MDGTTKKTFKPDSAKVVLCFGKPHTEPDAWGHALTNAQALTKKWLQMKAKVDFLDVRQPTRKAGVQDMLQVIVTLPMTSWTQILKSSGVDGVFVRPFVETDQDKLAYRNVPLPAGTTLPAANRQAQFLGEKAFGVVTYAAGFGIRVKPEDFNEILLQIHPENSEQFIGKKLEISGLPMAMGKASLLDFL